MPNARKKIIDVAFGGRPIGYNVIFSATNPNGAVTAPWGTLCLDVSGSGVYICTTSGTGWIIISA